MGSRKSRRAQRHAGRGEEALQGGWWGVVVRSGRGCVVGGCRCVPGFGAETRKEEGCWRAMGRQHARWQEEGS